MASAFSVGATFHVRKSKLVPRYGRAESTTSSRHALPRSEILSRLLHCATQPLLDTLAIRHQSAKSPEKIRPIMRNSQVLGFAFLSPRFRGRRAAIKSSRIVIPISFSGSFRMVDFTTRSAPMLRTCLTASSTLLTMSRMEASCVDESPATSTGINSSWSTVGKKP